MSVGARGVLELLVAVLLSVAGAAVVLTLHFFFIVSAVSGAAVRANISRVVERVSHDALVALPDDQRHALLDTLAAHVQTTPEDDQDAADARVATKNAEVRAMTFRIMGIGAAVLVALALGVIWAGRRWIPGFSGFSWFLGQALVMMTAVFGAELLFLFAVARPWHSVDTRAIQRSILSATTSELGKARS